MSSVPSCLKPWSGERDEWNGLLPQQRLAVEALLAREDFNFTEACKTAGYASPSATGVRLFKMPLVQKIIGRRIAQRCEDLGLDPKRAILELARLSYLDARKVIDPVSGTLLHLKDMDADVAACISSIKVTKRLISKAKQDDPDGADEEEQTTELKFWSKPAALEMLCKHLGILKELAPQLNVNILNGDFWDGLAKQVQAANEDSVERQLAASKVAAIERGTSKEEGVK